MPCTPDEFNQLAHNLSKSNDEISLRASVSRGYYSAYHYSLHYAFGKNSESNDWVGAEGGVHQNLISYLVKSKDFKEKSIGYTLKVLRTKRVLADYHLNESLSKEDAASMLVIVDKLIKQIKTKT